MNNVQQQVREAVDVLVESGPAERYWAAVIAPPGYLFTQVRGKGVSRSSPRVLF